MRIEAPARYGDVVGKWAVVRGRLVWVPLHTSRGEMPDEQVPRYVERLLLAEAGEEE